MNFAAVCGCCSQSTEAIFERVSGSEVVIQKEGMECCEGKEYARSISYPELSYNLSPLGVYIQKSRKDYQSRTGIGGIRCNPIDFW